MAYNIKTIIPFVIVFFLIVPCCQSNDSLDLSEIHDNVSKLTDSTLPQSYMIWSRDSRTIYYQQDDRICTVDIESDILYSLADGYHPTISNHSQELYFLKSTVGYEAGTWQGDLKAFVFDQNTHDITQINIIEHPYSGAEHAIWSPNGKYVSLYVREEIPVHYLDNGTVVDETSTRRIAIWDIITGEIHVIPDLRPRNTLPQWSPDGKSIAFIGYTDEEVDLSHQNGINPDLGIWIVDVNSRLAKKIASDENQIDYITWSPEGSKLSFSVLSHKMSASQSIVSIWTIEADGSNKKHFMDVSLFMDIYYLGRCFDWGPDETNIVFITYDLHWDEDRNINNQTMQEILAMDIDTMDRDLLLRTPFLHGIISTIDWSPDGRTIAFQYNPMTDDIVEGQLVIDYENPHIYLLDVS